MTPQQIINDEFTRLKIMLVSSGFSEETISEYSKYFSHGVEVGFTRAIEFAANEAMPAAIEVIKSDVKCWCCNDTGTIQDLINMKEIHCPICNR